MSEEQKNREMTAAERHLVQWMLEHGSVEARQFLPQLETALIAPLHCPCGCASIYFAKGRSELSGGMHPIADFVFGSDEDLSGLFVYEVDGVLAGVEVYGLTGDAPKTLPTPEVLRPFSSKHADA